MSDEATFLATLRANPTDATARGVFADWLDEQARPLDAARMRVLADPGSDARRLEFASACEAAGERERAKFVRVQVELARIAEGWQPNDLNCLDMYLDPQDYEGRTWEYRVSALVAREYKLALKCDFGAPFTDWLVRLSCDYHDRAEGPTYYVERGFVASVTCPATDWLRFSDAIREQRPIERVKLTTRPGISFGPLREYSRPCFNPPFDLILTDAWDVRIEGEPELRRVALDTVIREREHRTLTYERARVQADRIERINHARTVMGYLMWRWPGIAFELPPAAN